MKQELNKFSKYIKGEWLLQENFYLESNINIKNVKGKINFLQNSDNLLNIFNSQNNNILKSLDFNNDSNIVLEIKGIENNKLIAYMEKKNKTVYYQEKVYNTSNNIMISFGVLKNIKGNKYIGLKISSYIRVL